MKSDHNIKWYRNLYWGEKAGQQKRAVLDGFLDGAAHPRLYLIALPSNGKNLLDIFPQPVLLQEHYRKSELYAVGVSVGKTEAMRLAGQIVMDAYRTTGTTDIQTFLGDDYSDAPDELRDSWREW